MNIPRNIDLMGIIILKLEPECFNGILLKLSFVQCEMKISQDTKMIYHIIIQEYQGK
jgi:hypothetical protein